MFDRNELRSGFCRLGLRAGDTVMLHASVRAVGTIAGGPDQIHLALLDAISPGGTIMMYAGCPRYYDEVGRGNLTAEQEREVLEKLPAFDPLLDRAAQDNGVLVEFFRTYPGTVPSTQVARMVARGGNAAYLTGDQPFEFPLGAGSPCEKLLDLCGKIVLLGSRLSDVTFLHYVEHVSEFPGKRVLNLKVPALVQGERRWLDTKEVDTNGAHANWPEDLFAKITSGFLSATGNRGGQVGNAATYVLEADRLLAYAAAIMQAVATGQ